jgi:hypothetical protein
MKNRFFCILKVTEDLGTDPHPDPLVRGSEDQDLHPDPHPDPEHC